MTATNAIGWEVQVYSEDKGWTRDGDIVPTRDEAIESMKQKQEVNVHRRVYEALDFVPHT
jgi:hypothetical protein